eukprot:NODE_18986_length_865_cov_3.867209.p6 GENE.NODE_18986_length_865_cov_3.867209~~NODE_18986_length_865_cov_3.867209.p6  ORF type:complete len:52 (+),score=15.54 NODE_18986_length_865_cov_3.867209:624-779(+)
MTQSSFPHITQPVPQHRFPIHDTLVTKLSCKCKKKKKKKKKKKLWVETCHL